MSRWSEEEWKEHQELFPAYVEEARVYWQKFNVEGVIGEDQISLWLVDFLKTCEEEFAANCPPIRVFLGFAANKETLTEDEFLRMNVEVMKKR